MPDLACLHDQNKIRFLKGRLFPNQSELFEEYFTLIGWIKAGPPQKPLLFWSCKQANYVSG